MNRLDKVIQAISPRWALKRHIAEKQLSVLNARNAYAATETGNQRKTRIGGATTADDEVNSSLATMRELSRELDRNHDMAKGVLNTLVARVVGAQIIPQPLIKDSEGNLLPDVNRELLHRFMKWSYRPEVTKSNSWGKAARLACRTWLRDGEVLTKHIIGNTRGLNHSTEIPYSIELLEPDFLPVDYEDDAKNIKAGIKFNAWGEPRSYYLLKSLDSISLALGRFNSADVRTVPANKMTHLALKDRLHQTRGMSVFASVFTRLDDIKDYEESERIAARVAAAMTSFIKRDPEIFSAANVSSGDDDGNRYYEMSPGIIYDDLLPGEEPVSMQSNRPSGLLTDFRNSMLKMVSAGTGAGYSTISKNYEGTYSSQRQELVEQKGSYDILIDEFNNGWTRPIWNNFITAADAAGLLNLPPEADLTTLYDVHFQNPVIPWIDPKKEAEGNSILNNIGVKSRSKIIRELGENPDDVMNEVIKENEKMGVSETSVSEDIADEE